jgi:hypothetical protein
MDELIDGIVARSYDMGLNLDPGDFYVVNGALCIDGMPVEEWFEAVMMD